MTEEAENRTKRSMAWRPIEPTRKRPGDIVLGNAHRPAFVIDASGRAVRKTAA